MRMNNQKGLASAVFLWIVLALSTFSYAALAFGRDQRLRLRKDLEATQAHIQIFHALISARNNNFGPIENDEVQIEVLNEGQDRLRVVGRVPSGSHDVSVETGWVKAGGEWKAEYWRE